MPVEYHPAKKDREILNLAKGASDWQITEAIFKYLEKSNDGDGLSPEILKSYADIVGFSGLPQSVVEKIKQPPEARFLSYLTT